MRFLWSFETVHTARQKCLVLYFVQSYQSIWGLFIVVIGWHFQIQVYFFYRDRKLSFYPDEHPRAKYSALM